MARMDTMGDSIDSRTASTAGESSAPTVTPASPLPWRIEPISDVVYLVSGDKYFALLSEYEDGRDMTDARYIVTACNTHADLLAALKAVSDDRHACETMRARARAAIAKAEGK